MSHQQRENVIHVRDWLQGTTAGEVMTRAVVTLRSNATMGEAVQVLVDEMISGAPVVDEAGVCIGVLSLGEVARADELDAETRSDVAGSEFFQSPLALPHHLQEDRLDSILDKLVPVSGRLVDEFMTTDVVGVAKEAPLSDIVHAMIDAHLHRVVVSDTDGRLVGLVSATDVLAALMRVEMLEEAEDAAR